MAFKKYTLQIEQAGSIVSGLKNDGSLKIDEMAGIAILDFGTEPIGNVHKSIGLTHSQMPSAMSKVSVVAGEDETTTNQITCPGMAVGDEVVAVIVLTTAASIATAALHAGTMAAASGKITPGTKVNNTNNQYLIFWNDLT